MGRPTCSGWSQPVRRGLNEPGWIGRWWWRGDPAQRVRPDHGAGAMLGKSKQRLAHSQTLETIGPTEAWLEGVPPGKDR